MLTNYLVKRDRSMSTVNKINFKNKENIKKYLIKKYLVVNNNIYSSEKLFVANTAINWIFDKIKDTEVIKHYVMEIDKFLKGEQDLRWVNGILSKKKANNHEKK